MRMIDDEKPKRITREPALHRNKTYMAMKRKSAWERLRQRIRRNQIVECE